MKFQKGQSGNPAGRPKGRQSLSTAIRGRFQEHPEETEDLVSAIIGLARNGNPKALSLVWYALDGPEVKQVNLSQLSDEELLRALAVIQGMEDGSDTAGLEVA